MRFHSFVKDACYHAEIEGFYFEDALTGFKRIGWIRRLFGCEQVETLSPTKMAYQRWELWQNFAISVYGNGGSLARLKQEIYL